jgi:enterochelin esterase-like enzyme
MKAIPEAYLAPCSEPGKVVSLPYGKKFILLYTPAAPASRILYLIHGGGGNQYAFFCPHFLHMIDHMIAEGVMPPVYMVSPCFYDPDETDKTPSSSGRAVAKFCEELRGEIIPLAEGHIGRTFTRNERLISGFSMGGVTTWYAFLQALDLFYWFLPLSGDCWICGETGGGREPERTAAELAAALARQGAPDFRIHAITGSKDIAFPNLDAQIRAMAKYPEFSDERLTYSVLENGVHDYETIFRYLYNALPGLHP